MGRMRKEDVPVVADMLFDAFVRNKADFVEFSSVFDGSFEDDMAAAIRAVKDRRRPADVFDKQRKMTADLYAAMKRLRGVLRLLGEYVRMVEGDLKTLYAHYHIIEARRELGLRNVEGVLEHCEQIVDKLRNDDGVALAGVGFDAVRLGELEGLVGEVSDRNRSQQELAEEREDVRERELALFAAMHVFVGRVASVGKSMYSYRKKHKYDDFSVARILRRMNRKRVKKDA
jgi:hypothetical protein